MATRSPSSAGLARGRPGVPRVSRPAVHILAGALALAAAASVLARHPPQQNRTLAAAAEPSQTDPRQIPPSPERPSLPRSKTEKKILAVLDEMSHSNLPYVMNVPIADGRLLRILAESINAQQVIELGTSHGYSALWLALALKETGGKLTTHEIDMIRCKHAREYFQRAGVDDIVTLVEGDAHDEVASLRAPIDLLFIDADKPGYLDYLNKLLPKVRPGGLIVAHNMRRPPPDPAFVEAITTNPDLDTVFLNMHADGLSLSIKKR